MHEATIAASLLGIVRKSAAVAQVSDIAVIEVVIGRLRAVEADLLVSCFGFLAEGTICEGAELRIRKAPVTGQCGACGKITTVQGFSLRCDACGASELTILSGRELKVERILARTQPNASREDSYVQKAS